MIVPVLAGAAAWVLYRRNRGEPLLPHFIMGLLTRHEPHVAVLTPGGPALIPASTQVQPVTVLHPVEAHVLARAAANTQVSSGSVHVPRSLYTNPDLTSAAQGALGAFDPFDAETTAPSSLRVDSFGILRSNFSRPFSAR